MNIKDPKIVLQWLLDNKLVTTRFNNHYQEQIIEITEFGITINELMNKLREGSKATKETEKFMKEIDDNPYDAPPKTKELLQVLVKDINDIPDGDVDRYLIIGEIEKIIKNIK
jgi:hypothetical protein